MTTPREREKTYEQAQVQISQVGRHLGNGDDETFSSTAPQTPLESSQLDEKINNNTNILHDMSQTNDTAMFLKIFPTEKKTRNLRLESLKMGGIELRIQQCTTRHQLLAGYVSAMVEMTILIGLKDQNGFPREGTKTILDSHCSTMWRWLILLPNLVGMLLQ